MAQNMANTEFSILNLLCHIKKRRTLIDCFFCEDSEYLIYIDLAKTGENLSLVKVCLFLHRQFTQNLNVQHLIN